MSRRSARALLLFFLTALAAAHDTWLQADPGHAPGSARRLSLTSGMAFPALDYAPLPERVERVWGGAPGAERPLAAPHRGAQALVFRAPATPGASAWAVQLKPKTLSMESAEVAHYLDEIHAGPELRRRWEQQPEPRHWREQYIKHAKALVSAAGSCASLASRPLGLGLELLLDTDLCALKPGDTLPVRAVQNGAARAGLVLSLVAAGGREIASRVTDAAGRAEFHVPSAGPWLLRATDLRPSALPGLDWQSDFTTLTFDLR